MSVKPEEKLALMLELGLENAAGSFAEANALATMRFRPITEQKIKQLLSVEYPIERRLDADMRVPLFMLSVFVGAGLVKISSVAGTSATAFSIAWACSAFVLYKLFSYLAYRNMKTTRTAAVCAMPLQDWEDNLPYGALLAVKEAKAQKFTDFEIWFPAKWDSEMGMQQRLKDDPIITARKKGSDKLYNIFAWDDSKVYE